MTTITGCVHNQQCIQGAVVTLRRKGASPKGDLHALSYVIASLYPYYFLFPFVVFGEWQMHCVKTIAIPSIYWCFCQSIPPANVSHDLSLLPLSVVHWAAWVYYCLAYDNWQGPQLCLLCEWAHGRGEGWVSVTKIIDQQSHDNLMSNLSELHVKPLYNKVLFVVLSGCILCYRYCHTFLCSQPTYVHTHIQCCWFYVKLIP